MRLSLIGLFLSAASQIYVGMFVYPVSPAYWLTLIPPLVLLVAAARRRERRQWVTLCGLIVFFQVVFLAFKTLAVKWIPFV